MVTITIQGADAKEALRELEFLHVLRHESVALVGPHINGALPQSAKEAKPTKDKKETPAEASATAIPAPLTYDTVSGAIAKVLKHAGRPKTVEILGQFGAKSGKDLKESQYVEFMIVANATLAGPKYEAPKV